MPSSGTSVDACDGFFEVNIGCTAGGGPKGELQEQFVIHPT